MADSTQRLTELHGRKIAFPEVQSFADLFDDVKPHGKQARELARLKSWEAGTWSDKAGKTYCTVSGYLSISGGRRFRSLDVNAKPNVMEYVRSSMLHGSYDTIHFSVTIWKDGRALVCAQYSQIIGSHYLAIIDAATIPEAI